MMWTLVIDGEALNLRLSYAEALVWLRVLRASFPGAVIGLAVGGN